MPYTVSALSFQGPLGLLIELAEKGRLELADISVGTITADYLLKVKNLGVKEPDELSDFLRLGSRLAYIKSAMLLPQSTTLEPQRELALLNDEMAEYRRFQQAARTLAARLGSESSWSRDHKPLLSPEDLALPPLNVDLLQKAFTAALRKIPAAIAVHAELPELSQAKVQENLTGRLGHGPFALDEVLVDAPDRFHVIVIFLALLELIRAGAAGVVQAGQYAPIMIVPARG